MRGQVLRDYLEAHHIDEVTFGSDNGTKKLYPPANRKQN
jgi:hypothetical protein